MSTEQLGPFVLVDDPTTYRREVGCFVARIPPASGKAELLQLLKDQLQMPDYFGGNWDALADCLSDLSWLKAREVALVHLAIPSLSESELRQYLDILADARATWSGSQSHRLVLVFPNAASERIEAALASKEA